MIRIMNKSEQNTINTLVKTYQENMSQVQLFRDQLMLALINAKSLKPHVHSFKSRIKDPEHLRDKLRRKLQESKRDKSRFTIDSSNLLIRINDLVGVRILHLYTRQIKAIDISLRSIFEESRYRLCEKPFARTWDDESREYFKGCGISTQGSPSLYTSVHYVVGSASRTEVTAEIQVRTLSEELWGEVDHSLNYPHQSPSIACREQLKVLARVTSSASRLVDSIFLAKEDFDGKRKRTKSE